MSRWRTLACTLFVLGLCGPAMAQGQAEAQSSLDALDQALAQQGLDACSGPPTTKADQVLLLHTQLMVASLACGDQYGDPAAYDHYREFTARNGDLIAGAEAEIQQRLGLERFDTYRTEIANAESDMIAHGSTLRYCRIRQSRFSTLIGAQPAQVSAYADDLARRAQVRHQGSCQ